MAKTKREYILATCFLSGIAAILSFVSVGTQEWIYAIAQDPDSPGADATGDYFKVGLFGGIFVQSVGIESQFELTTACAFDYNICAYLCGDNMVDNVKKLYYGYNNTDQTTCSILRISPRYSTDSQRRLKANSAQAKDRIFMNAGVWICTIIFLVISGVMGIISSGLAVWNTASSPYQVYFSVFGLYIYNAIAFFTILLSIILFGAMFAQDLLHNIPSYKTFLEAFSTDGSAYLGYSYWLNLVSLVLYLMSMCVLYVRDYLISKEPQQNLELEESADPVIYLY